MDGIAGVVDSKAGTGTMLAVLPGAVWRPLADRFRPADAQPDSCNRAKSARRHQLFDLKVPEKKRANFIFSQNPYFPHTDMTSAETGKQPQRLTRVAIRDAVR